MASTDLDIYSECVGGTQDVLQYYLVPSYGSRPRGMPAGAAIYGFTDFTDESTGLISGPMDLKFWLRPPQFVPRPVLHICPAHSEWFHLLRLFLRLPPLQLGQWLGFQRV